MFRRPDLQPNQRLEAAKKSAAVHALRTSLTSGDCFIGCPKAADCDDEGHTSADCPKQRELRSLKQRPLV